VENLKKFGDKLKDFGGKLKDFSGKIKDLDTGKMTTVATKLKEFAKSMQDLSKLNLKVNLYNVVTDGVTGMYDAVIGSETAIKSYGKAIITWFSDGVDSQKRTLYTNITTIATDAGSKFQNGYSNAYTGGSYVIDGFVAGIDANVFRAEAAAAAAAEAALEAAKDALGIKSPSREFYAVGEYSGLGFVNALHDFASTSYDAGTEVATYAKDGLSDAISKVSDVINSDMDTQPTIRPVLDLSDVRAGASTIGSLFSTDPTVGVLANVGTISSMMNKRVQNGNNDDVVSAIDKLRKDLGNIGGDTYSINGVSYDAESDVADAVKTIARAIKVGRRV
jgi:hypothetical protein